MRFSDLNRAKAEEAAKEPPKKPAPPDARKPPAGPAAAKKAAPEEPPAPPPQPPAETASPAPAAGKEEALERRVPAYRPQKARHDAAAARPPSEPFSDLDARAREIYSRMIGQAGELLRGVSQPYTEKYEAVLRVCDLAVEDLRTSSVLLNYTAYSTGDDYLRAHSANTAVLALAMGLAADLEPSELRLLGFCAMAHDIGMPDYAEIYGREARLTDEEFSAVALHPEAGAEKLDRIVDLDYRVKDRVKRIILQTHERTDGSGYPDRLSEEHIDPLAQFVAIADVYEAMTHPRAWRDGMNPAAVVKELIEREGRGFNAEAVKALLSAVSIYPPGALVLLSTGETARVIKVNKGSLTRPLVEVLLDPDSAQTAPVQADLLEHPLTSVERALDLAELETMNPKLAAKLELSRWWTDW